MPSDEEKFWTDKIKEHSWTFIICIVVIAVAVFFAVFVLISLISTSTLGGLGTWTFDQWTLNYVVGFMILVTLWELLLVGLPVGLFFCLGGFLWWRKLPEEEKNEFNTRRKREEKKHNARNYGGGGGGFSFFMFIAFCIYIFVDGKYDVQFGDQPYSYWLFSYLLTMMWIFIVFGIPVFIIILIYFFTNWGRKSE